MNDERRTDERIRAFIQAEAPARAPAGLLEASLARSVAVAPLPSRRTIAGVPRVWLAVAATLGLVITTVIGMALASEASRRDDGPRPAPSAEAQAVTPAASTRRSMARNQTQYSAVAIE